MFDEVVWPCSSSTAGRGRSSARIRIRASRVPSAAVKGISSILASPALTCRGRGLTGVTGRIAGEVLRVIGHAPRCLGCGGHPGGRPRPAGLDRAGQARFESRTTRAT